MSIHVHANSALCLYLTVNCHSMGALFFSFCVLHFSITSFWTQVCAGAHLWIYWVSMWVLVSCCNYVVTHTQNCQKSWPNYVCPCRKLWPTIGHANATMANRVPMDSSLTLRPTLDKPLEIGLYMQDHFQLCRGHPKSHLCPSGVWHSQRSCPSPN